MATYTENYGLTKPDPTDFYSIEDQNGNMDDVDAALHGLEARKADAAHKSQHAIGGTDELSPADIGAASKVELDAHKADYISPHQYLDEGTDLDWVGVKYRLVMIDGEVFMEVIAV